MYYCYNIVVGTYYYEVNYEFDRFKLLRSLRSIHTILNIISMSRENNQKHFLPIIIIFYSTIASIATTIIATAKLHISTPIY